MIEPRVRLKTWCKVIGLFCGTLCYPRMGRTECELATGKKSSTERTAKLCPATKGHAGGVTLLYFLRGRATYSSGDCMLKAS